MANPDIEVCVLSSEHFHSRLLEESSVYRFRDLIAGFFDDVVFFLHLRPQVDLAVSLASTAARCHSTVNSSFFANIKSDSLYYDYFKLYKRWKTVFPQIPINVLSYIAKPSFVDVFTDEMSALNIDVSDIVPPDRENSAVDVRAMALINALNAASLPAGQKFKIKPPVLSQLPFEHPLQLPRDLAISLQNKFVESNQNLCDALDYFDIKELHPDLSRYPKSGNLNILDNTCLFSEHLHALLNIQLG